MSLLQTLHNIPSALFAVFIGEYSSVIRNITSIPFVWTYGHIVGLQADRGQCRLLLNTYIFACWVTGSLYHNVTEIFFSSLANHKYDLCSCETWMLKKPRKSFMQPKEVCLPWLNSYSCHTQLYARLWEYLSSYSKLVHLCVWILFMWYQKLKVSRMVVFRAEGNFGPTT